MARAFVIIWLAALTSCFPVRAVAQRRAQNYALGTFTVNGSALIPIPARIDDSISYVVLMNPDLAWVLAKRKTFMPLGYCRYVRSHIRREKPTALSTQEVKDQVTSLAPLELVERYAALDHDSLLNASFDARGLLLQEEESREGAAVITVLFRRGVIVSMDDESGVAYLDTGWKSDRNKDIEPY